MCYTSKYEMQTSILLLNTTALGAKIFKKDCSSFVTLVSMEDILIEKIGKETVRNKWGGCCVLLNQSPTLSKSTKSHT